MTTSSSPPPHTGEPPIRVPPVVSALPPVRIVPPPSLAVVSALPSASAAPLTTLSPGTPAASAAPLTTFNSAPQSLPLRAWYSLCAGGDWLFGLASVLGCLMVLAPIPILQFISLGYLLEVSGRVARSGKLRDGFIDLPKFARVGGMVAGTWLMLLPLRLLALNSRDAHLIDPGGSSDRAWRTGLVICTTFMVAHILLAWYSGGKLRHFFWPLLAPFQFGMKLAFGRVIGPLMRPLMGAISPKFAADLYVPRPLSTWFPPAILWAGIRRGNVYTSARDAVWEFVLELRIPYYFWLGARGFVGALAWLFLPVLLLVAGTSVPGLGILLGWLGAFGLALVLIYLPFLQTHFARENRFAAMFEIGAVRAYFRRAPIAFWFGLTITLLLALPLYLLKIEFAQREIAALLSLFFIAFIFPARLLTGWALGRAQHRDAPRVYRWRWLNWLMNLDPLPVHSWRGFFVRQFFRITAIPIVLAYILIVWLTQYTSWSGPASLFEQHAFLVPVPFLGG